MAITVDTKFDLSSERKHGRVVKLTRRLMLSGLTTTGSNPGNYCHQVTTSSIVPRSPINVGGTILFFDSETVQVGDDVPHGQAKVDQTFVWVPNAVSTANGPQLLDINGGTSLRQVTTQKDAAGDQITVSHTWPSDAKQLYPNGTKKAGTTETQGGQISVLVPTTSLVGVQRVACSLNQAITISKNFTGKLNSVVWHGDPVRTWMCTRVPFQLVDDMVNPPVYEFTFEFEYDENTWDNDTTAVFVDSSTGEPPSGLVDGTGIKQIEYYDAIDFNQYFNTLTATTP